MQMLLINKMIINSICLLLFNVHICFSTSWIGRKGVRIDELARSDFVECSARDRKFTIPVVHDNQNAPSLMFSYQMVNNNTNQDPLSYFQKLLKELLFGPVVADAGPSSNDDTDTVSTTTPSPVFDKNKTDELIHYPSGNILRAERFQGKIGVHLPPNELIHRGHCRLNVTKDYMQTAVNAFNILLYGNLEDVLHLPSEYVLNSARTISMMKIAREKLAITWTVVKNGRDPIDIPFMVLEKYRPLFKYLRGQEMARLNLSDERILTYIGTHAELNRHQMGIVASRYIRLNPKWSEPKYLNKMNNLLCGMPITYMRRINRNVYLQLTHQAFYHIRACDNLQKRFYLSFMTKAETLGKSYSWSARDVSRLGLLLAEVDGIALAAINPEAMSGITAQVMLAIQPQNLQSFTEIQMRYLGLKPLNILARRLKEYKEETRIRSSANKILTFAIYLISKYLVIAFGIMLLI